MKIALVFPRVRYPSGDPPLGLAYLAGMLEAKAGLDANIIDLSFERRPFKFLRACLSKEKYDLIGISMMSSMVSAASRVAAIARQVQPDCLVAAGGPHPTMSAETVLKDPNIDLAVIGESERTILELVSSFPRHEDVAGLAYVKNDRVVYTDRRQPIDELDDIPLPAWHRLPMQTYLRTWFQMDSVPGACPGTSVIASRGCPHRCTYCQPTLRTMFGQRLRKRSATGIAREIASLVERYQIRGFMFQDDTFTIDRKWAAQVASEIWRSCPGIAWACNARADTLDEGLLSHLRRHGLRKVNIGIETASQRVLDDIYQKDITVEQVRRSVRTAKEIDLMVQGYFMLGAPGETLAEVEETIRFARDLPLDDATFSITTPLPGTELWNRTKEAIQPGTVDFDYYGQAVYRGQSIDPATLRKLKRKAYLEFYLKPGRLPNLTRHLLLSGGPQKTLLKLRRLL